MSREERENAEKNVLDRIADSLEKIADTAEAVKGCISEKGEFIGIGGEVYVDGDVNVTVERDNLD